MHLKFVIVSVVLLACSPVKQVLKDPKKFEIVKEAVIRSGACVNDTITIETIKDTVYYKDSIVNSIIQVPCKDFDTIMPDGARIMVSSGAIKYKPKYKETIITKTITNNIRDKKLEDYLRKDVSNRDSIIKVYKSLYSTSQDKLKESSQENTRLKWKIYLVVAVSLIWTFRGQILKLVRII